jgi:carbohydrate-binding DOMON domain-containing protein
VAEPKKVYHLVVKIKPALSLPKKTTPTPTGQNKPATPTKTTDTCAINTSVREITAKAHFNNCLSFSVKPSIYKGLVLDPARELLREQSKQNCRLDYLIELQQKIPGC